MAKLSNLMAAVTDTFQMAPGAVEAYVKPLRKAGFLTTGGRGTGAPEITTKDCARLLIVTALGSPLNAVDNVSRYGGLVPPPNPQPLSKPGIILSSLGIDSTTTLEDFIAHMINIAVTKNLDEAIKDVIEAFISADSGAAKLPETLAASKYVYYEISIKLEMPEALCCVEFSVSFMYNDTLLCYKQEFYFVQTSYWEKKDCDKYYGTLHRSASFSNYTICDIAAIMSPQPN